MSKGREPSRSKASALSLTRGRLWAFRIITSVAAPTLLLVVPELALRVFGYGHAPGFFVPIRGHHGMVTTNDRFGYGFFHPAMARSPVVSRTSASKRDGAFRIFLIGSSAARGTPDAAYSVGRSIEAMLRDRYPGADFEVVNTGMAAINSHVAVCIARDCATLGGDLFVVYMGNNEVIGPYGPGTVLRGQSANRVLIRLGIWVRATRLGQLAANLIGGRPGARTQWGGMGMFIDRPVTADDPRLERVYANFRANLEAVCAAAARAGAPTIICTVPVNLKDCPPFASVHRPGISSAELKVWEQAYALGGELEMAGDLARAEAAYVEARSIDDRHAALEFRLGRVCLALGRHDDARSHFLRALELDALRFRADAAINGVITEVARRPGARLVDAAGYLAAHDSSEHGIIGNALLYEHVHLNFEGQYLFAVAVLEEVEKLLPASIKARGTARSQWATRVRCAELLAFTEYEALQSLEGILEMRSAPPFTGQEGHAETLAEWRRVVGDLRGRAGGPEGARRSAESLRAALRERPGDVLLAKKLAERLFAAGDRAGGIAETRRLMEEVPGVAAWHLALARMLRDVDDADGAAAEFREAIALRPRSSDAHEARNELGMMLLRRDKPSEAAALFKAAVAYSPGSWIGNNNLGTAYAAVGRIGDAERAFRDAIELRPNYARAHFNLAALIVKAGRIEEALGELRLAIESDPEFAEAHEALGRLLLLRRETKAAAIHLRAAARLNPRLPGIQEALQAAERAEE